MSEDPHLQVAVPPAVAGQGGEVLNPAVEEQPPVPEESQATKVINLIKSVGTQALMMYFVMSFFKKPQQQQPGDLHYLHSHSSQPLLLAQSGAVATVNSPATNLYQDGMSFDLYVYLSEQEEFGDFQVLFWCAFML